MSKTVGRRRAVVALVATLAFGAGWASSSPQQREPTPGPIGSAVVTRADATPLAGGDWGEMRAHFRGETHGTNRALAAVATVLPGQAVHPAHRHLEEEYLYIAEGSGRWHLDGEELPASAGDVLYAAPWVMHGLVNTGDVPLVFFVAKWSSKGVPAAPEPPGPHGR